MRFCAEYCERFHKNGGLDLRFCTKTEQRERDAAAYSWPLTCSIYHYSILQGGCIGRLCAVFILIASMTGTHSILNRGVETTFKAEGPGY